MATKKNINQDTTLMVIAIMILVVTITCLVSLSFFWSLGETKNYVFWLMPNDYSLALAWFVQFGADAFRIAARLQTNKRLVWILYSMAVVFNVADGSTNLGALRRDPLRPLAGYDTMMASFIEIVIAYGTAMAEELIVILTATMLKLWGAVSVDCGMAGWTRPIWLVGKLPNKPQQNNQQAKQQQPRQQQNNGRQQQPTVTPHPQFGSDLQAQPVRVAQHPNRRTRQRPPVPSQGRGWQS